jgi:hypothetical protein
MIPEEVAIASVRRRDIVRTADYRQKDFGTLLVRVS